jgi:hypothetical protein
LRYPFWYRKNYNTLIFNIIKINLKKRGEVRKIVLFAEVKRNKNNINLKGLEEKSTCLMSHFEGYKILYRGFSLDDI